MMMVRMVTTARQLKEEGLVARKKYECIAQSQHYMPKNASILTNYALNGNGEFSFLNHPSYHGFTAKNIYKGSVL